MAEHAVVRQQARGIVRLTMDHGANALDFELIAALREAILELASQGQAPPLLLSSAHPTVFSPGWDLKRLVAADRAEIGAFLAAFNGLILDLFSYPGPTAAAVNGHAVAGGCLLALACDLRFMVATRCRIGLAELNLGVPVPKQCVLMLAARLAPWVVDQLIFGGDGFGPSEALPRGIIHRKASAETLLRTAEQALTAIASKPPAGVVASKRFRFQAVWQAMAATPGEDETAFVDAWFAAGAQQRIAATVDTLSR
jgi:enoyl-CoA hydratase